MQKYRVFINRHLIFLSENQNLLVNSDNFKLVLEPTQDEIIAIVEKLLSEKQQGFKYLFNYSSIEDGWNIFRNCFQEIEAAGGIVLNSEGNLLVIHRLGYWDLPKGKLEKNESIEEAAIREVEEECGISGLMISSKLPPTYHIYSHKSKLILKQTHWFKMKYEGNEKLIPQTEEAIEQVLWVKAEERAKILANTYESLKPLFETHLI